MPLRKEVPSLQKLGLKSCVNYTDIANSIINQIFQNNRQQNEDYYRKLESTIDSMKQYCDLQPSTKSDLSSEIEQTLYTYLTKMDINADSKNSNMFKDLLNIAKNTNLKKFEFCRVPSEKQRYLYCTMHLLTNLEDLEMSSMAYDSYADRFSIRMLSAMTNLKSLKIGEQCTNDILITVAQNCPNLRALHVYGADHVTDKCITYLKKCQNLQDVCFTDTKISPTGYVELLLDCSSLRHIRNFEQIQAVFEILDSKRIENPLNIEILEYKYARNLELIVKYFPKLKKLVINWEHIRDEDKRNLEILKDLSDLQALFIYCANFRQHGIDQLLEKVGKNLTWVYLDFVGGLDFNALVLIDKVCPDLEVLEISGSSYVDKNLPGISKKKNKLFRKLKKLNLAIRNFPDSDFEILLINAKSLELLSCSFIDMTEDSVRSIFSKAGLNKLKKFEIYCSKHLTITNVDYIIMNCKNLVAIEGLYSCKNISKEELQVFKNHLKKNNYEVNLC